MTRPPAEITEALRDRLLHATAEVRMPRVFAEGPAEMAGAWSVGKAKTIEAMLDALAAAPAPASPDEPTLRASISAAWAAMRNGIESPNLPFPASIPELFRVGRYNVERAYDALIEARAASASVPPLSPLRLAEIAMRDHDAGVNGFVVDNVLDMANLLARWLAAYAETAEQDR